LGLRDSRDEDYSYVNLVSAILFFYPERHSYCCHLSATQKGRQFAARCALLAVGFVPDERTPDERFVHRIARILCSCMRARNFAGRQAAAHLAGDEPAMPQALILSTKRSIAHARHSARLKPFRSPLQCNASPGTLDTLQVTAARLQPVPRTHQPARLRLLGDWRHTPLFREASGTIAPPSGHLRELQHAGVECSLLSCRWLAASSVQGPRARSCCRHALQL
jgi:hypothetical protein